MLYFLSRFFFSHSSPCSYFWFWAFSLYSPEHQVGFPDPVATLSCYLSQKEFLEIRVKRFLLLEILGFRLESEQIWAFRIWKLGGPLVLQGETLSMASMIRLKPSHLVYFRLTRPCLRSKGLSIPLVPLRTPPSCVRSCKSRSCGFSYDSCFI